MRLSIFDDYQGVALDMADWSPVRARGIEIVVERHPFVDEDAAARALADCEIVAAMRERTPFPRSLVDRLPKLKLLITTGMRNASFDMAALKDRGVTVCGTGGPGGGNEDTAELAWGLILGAARRIAEDHAIMRHGGWQTRIGHRVAGKTLGLSRPRPARQRGRAGRARLRHEGDRLEPEPDGRESRRARRRAGREGRAVPPLRHALGAPRSEHAQPRPGRRPRDRADEAERDPGQHLARPDCDTEAVIAALKAGRLAYAGFDVYDKEPLPIDHPLRQAPNVILTPHIGYVTDENYRSSYPQIVENVVGFLDGKPVRVI